MQARVTRASEADTPVIAARLVPPSATRLVSRERLLDQLDAFAARPLTLLAAPAGSGKTALLADWLHTRAPERVAWLTLDASDDDRRRFWADVSAALARVLDEPGSEPLAGLHPPPLGSFDGFVATFLNAAAATNRRVTLVLDDAQELRSAAVLADLDLLLEHAPAGLRLIMATRVDPSLRLARLRMAGSVDEIRFSDLGFTLDEARQLLRQDHPGTPADAVAALWAKTEGWAAGLRIAALAMRQHPADPQFAEGFAGDHRPILNYLVDEVFAGLPTAISDFLLATAGLSRVSAPLADAARHRDDSAEILDELVRRNLLIVPVDTPEQWYRYHPLFVEALLLLQRRQIPGDLPELHARAACWYAEHGHPLEAIEHAIKAGDWALAGRLLVDHWLPLTIAGETAALRTVAARIPIEIMRGDAEVALAVAGIELEEGGGGASDELLAMAAELAPALPVERVQPYEVGLAMTMLFRSRSDADPTAAVEAGRRVLSSRWDRSMSASLRAFTRMSLGVAEIWLSDLDAAARDLQAGRALADEASIGAVLVNARGWAALVDVLQGRLVEAHREATAALRSAAEHGWAADSHAAPAHAALATVALYWNDLGAAEHSTADAIDALGRSGERNLRAWIAVVDATLHALRREPETGLDRLLRLTASHGDQPALPPRLQMAVTGAEARLRLLLGEQDAADRLASALEGERHPVALIAAAAVRLGMHEPGRALEIADRVLACAAADPSTLIEAWVVRAIALDVHHEQTAAATAMERALDLAEPRGFRRPLLDGGLRTGLLLRRVVRQGTAHRVLVDELLAALEGSTQIQRREPAPLGISEPLSQRELMVLRYMPTSMPYAEVASELFVSVNTIKTHVRHVYRKLEVDSRRNAVARATELRLLSPSGSIPSNRSAPNGREFAAASARAGER